MSKQFVAKPIKYAVTPTTQWWGVYEDDTKANFDYIAAFNGEALAVAYAHWRNVCEGLAAITARSTALAAAPAEPEPKPIKFREFF